MLKLPMLGLAIVLILASCTTSQNPRVQAIQNLTVTCQAIAAATNTLAAYNRMGQLTKEQVATIRGLAPVVDELCDDKNAPTDAVTALNRATQVLNSLAQVQINVEQKP